ncbi:MAG: class I SAM-dependent methyltransferase [Tenacibaculum sp.]|uniref:class I SAM-dependent methyltransferase n=1 Tax=Tenacibaculum sp. TaxID=1906242 RepID=UPI001848A503|nr:class I SAM-dependent methyltransferase [Tenacibaculum sp.]NVK09149.1 class I SAM-dependent methyltransferase [Tenacibaculum sp.]
MKKSDLKYIDFWNERYQDLNFAYGKEPNLFFKKELQKLKTGSILLPADGEGRNGVYASKLGWDVTATDLSIEGKSKALKLANEFDTNLKYVVGDIQDLEFPKESFDAIGLIYAHFTAWKISAIHQKLTTLLKPKGYIIFEAFSKNHLKYQADNPKIGGPKDINMLFSIEQIQQDFTGFEIQTLEEKEVFLNEGNSHNGKGSVIRFIGKKL